MEERLEKWQLLSEQRRLYWNRAWSRIQFNVITRSQSILVGLPWSSLKRICFKAEMIAVGWGFE